MDQVLSVINQVTLMDHTHYFDDLRKLYALIQKFNKFNQKNKIYGLYH